MLCKRIQRNQGKYFEHVARIATGIWRIKFHYALDTDFVQIPCFHQLTGLKPSAFSAF